MQSKGGNSMGWMQLVSVLEHKLNIPVAWVLPHAQRIPPFPVHIRQAKVPRGAARIAKR